MDRESIEVSETNRTTVESVFLSNEKRIRAVAYSCTPAPDMIDDIVQEVFLELVTKQDRWTLTDPKQVRHLLAVLTQQVTKRLWKKRRRNMPDSLVRIADRLYRHPDQADVLLEEDRNDRLFRALDRLKPDEQTLLRRYYFEQVSTGGLAAELGITEDHVRRNLSRARQKLRDKLNETDKDRS